MAFFNIVMQKETIIIKQLPFNLENSMLHQEKKVQCQLIVESNIILPIMKKMLMINQER
jgi:hypothetical protein